jgi:hypothetical protein
MFAGHVLSNASEKDLSEETFREQESRELAQACSQCAKDSRRKEQKRTGDLVPQCRADTKLRSFGRGQITEQAWKQDSRRTTQLAGA